MITLGEKLTIHNDNKEHIYYDEIEATTYSDGKEGKYTCTSCRDILVINDHPLFIDSYYSRHSSKNVARLEGVTISAVTGPDKGIEIMRYYTKYGMHRKGITRELIVGKKATSAITNNGWWVKHGRILIEKVYGNKLSVRYLGCEENGIFEGRLKRHPRIVKREQETNQSCRDALKHLLDGLNTPITPIILHTSMEGLRGCKINREQTPQVPIKIRANKKPLAAKPENKHRDANRVTMKESPPNEVTIHLVINRDNKTQ